MFGIAEFIVGLWFLPVTLFVIIPLTITIGWQIVMFANSLRKQEGKEHD